MRQLWLRPRRLWLRAQVTAVSGATTAYGYGSSSHRLNSVGATARGYDDAGNTTQIGGAAKAFAYNDLNRMSQYLESGIVKRNYAYNGRGEQVRTWLAANDDRYSLYAVSGQWLGEYDSAGAPVQQIVWLGDLPVGVLTGSGVAQKLHYIEADALGTPRVVVDPARGAGGTAVWRWELTREAFGSTAPDQDPDGDSVAFVFDMRFPGQRYDAVSGLNQNGFRDYEPDTGRYPQSDPIGLGGGISMYAYVSGNPMVRIDPDGLSTIALPFFPEVPAVVSRFGPPGAAIAGGLVVGGLAGNAINGFIERNFGNPGTAVFDILRPEGYSPIVSGGGRAAAPAPYDHFEENEALNFMPDPFGGKEQCELIAFMIGVLRAQIAWRKTDLNPSSTSYQNHLTRIAVLTSALVRLEAAYRNICGGDCPA